MSTIDLDFAESIGGYREPRRQGPRKLPLLGNDDETANREYIKQLVLAEDKEIGEKHGLRYAEPFHYIGPKQMSVDEYVEANAV